MSYKTFVVHSWPSAFAGPCDVRPQRFIFVKKENIFSKEMAEMPKPWMERHKHFPRCAGTYEGVSEDAEPLDLSKSCFRTGTYVVFEQEH